MVVHKSLSKPFMDQSINIISVFCLNSPFPLGKEKKVQLLCFFIIHALPKLDLSSREKENLDNNRLRGQEPETKEGAHSQEQTHIEKFKRLLSCIQTTH